MLAPMPSKSSVPQQGSRLSRNPSPPGKTQARKRGAGGAGATGMRRVHHRVLDNGLRVFVIEARELPVVSHMIWYTVGSRDERTSETGLSHFLEHMMFKGTKKYAKGEIDAITQRLGGNNNAFTDQDTTAYYFSLKSDHWDEALAIEASRMQGCLLDPEEFESEKKVVIDELKMGEDDDWRPLYQAVEQIAFLTHPYHHPIIGWLEDLERLDRESMVEYYRRHYTPDRAILVLVGDVDAKDAIARIDKKLGKIPSSGRARPSVLREPAQRGIRRITIKQPGNTPRLALCWRGCRVGDPDDPVLDVVSTLLTSGKAARLYRGLVQGREIATEVHAMNEARLDPGLFTILAEGKPGGSLEAIEAAILEEVERLASSGPAAAELRRVKKQISNSFFFELETVYRQAYRIGRYEACCDDGWRVLEEYPKVLQTITKDDVRDTMARIFHEDALSVAYAVPTERA